MRPTRRGRGEPTARAAAQSRRRAHRPRRCGARQCLTPVGAHAGGQAPAGGAGGGTAAAPDRQRAAPRWRRPDRRQHPVAEPPPQRHRPAPAGRATPPRRRAHHRSLHVDQRRGAGGHAAASGEPAGHGSRERPDGDRDRPHLRGEPRESLRPGAGPLGGTHPGQPGGDPGGAGPNRHGPEPESAGPAAGQGGAGGGGGLADPHRRPQFHHLLPAGPGLGRWRPAGGGAAPVRPQPPRFSPAPVPGSGDPAGGGTAAAGQRSPVAAPAGAPPWDWASPWY